MTDVDTARPRQSLRARVALLVAAAVGLAVALAAVAAYVTIRHELQSNLDDSLRSRAEGAAHTSLIQGLDANDLQQQIVGQVLSGLASDVQLAIVDNNGVRLYTKDLKGALGAPEFSVAAGIVNHSLRTITVDGSTYRVVAVPIRPGLALVLAQSTAETDHELNRMALVMVIVGAGGIVLAATAGLAVARAGLKPVEQLTDATEHIARTEDLRPIPVRGTDELARLTTSFNTMLGALAQSRERQRQLIADAGHELRTPLTSLRTNLDLLAQLDRSGAAGISEADRAELLADVQAQLAELSSLVGDLVELARTDAPQGVAEWVDLSAVADHAVARARRRAPGVRFDVTTEPWLVWGDATLLERAAMNLLDNAAKWSPAQGTVTVGLREGVLQVADEGPGIAPEDLPHVFERFYRATDARGLPGSGLGLAIVRQAAQRHGGFVHAGTAERGGALLTMGIPGRPPGGDSDQPADALDASSESG